MPKRCPKCGEPMVVVESFSSTRPATEKVKCQNRKCGYEEVRDERGAALLLEVPDGRANVLES